MTWSIDLPNLRASHTSGLQVNLIPDGNGRYLFQAVEGTKHHLAAVPNKKDCIVELGTRLMLLLEKRH